MEDLIKKIIEVDKEARQKTEESKEQLSRSKTAIEKRKKELEELYNQSVEEIIALTTQDENKKVQEQKADIDKSFLAADKALEETFIINKDKWVKELVERTIASE